MIVVALIIILIFKLVIRKDQTNSDIIGSLVVPSNANELNEQNQ